MTINYLLTPSNKLLFSFHRRDYRIEDGLYIDGGFDYTRSNGMIEKGNISDLIVHIREQFKWGRNYNKDGTRLDETEYALLKDLSTDHILAILVYFTERLSYASKITSEWKAYHLIFIHELKYRHENQIN